MEDAQGAQQTSETTVGTASEDIVADLVEKSKWEIKETPQELPRGVAQKSSLAEATSSASKNIVADLLVDSKGEVPCNLFRLTKHRYENNRRCHYFEAEIKETPLDINKAEALSGGVSTEENVAPAMRSAIDNSIADLLKNSKGGYKEISDGLPVIAKGSGLGNITVSSLNENVAEFQKDVKTFREKNRIQYQGRA